MLDFTDSLKTAMSLTIEDYGLVDTVTRRRTGYLEMNCCCSLRTMA